MRTSIRLVAVLALVLAACGGGTVDTTSTTGDTTTTTEPTTTTTESSTTTTTAASTTTTAPVATVPVSVFFMADGGDSPERPGPFLVSVYRAVVDDGGPAAAAVRALVEGPTDAERDAGISSEVPEDTELLGITIEDGRAVVDLSGRFEQGGGSLSMFARLAQLTATLTSFDTIDGVELRLDGEPVDVFSGEGVILDDPMTLLGFEDLLPGILVVSPAWGAPITDPVVVEGVAAAFEGVFQLEVLDEAGAVVAAPDFVQTDEGMGWGNFSIQLDLDVDPPADLTIHVWEFSAKDGSVISERFVPVHLEA